MNRKGFTLIEVLVILSILAALAAILVPTVANQVRKSDVSRVTGDLTNLRSGIEAFLVNVHRYPGDIEDLIYPVTTDGTDTDINANNYSPGLASRWEGPYIDRVLAEGDSLETGFAGYIHDEFLNETVDDVPFLTVRITHIAEPEFILIDDQLDEGNGATAGRLRWWDGDTDPDSMYFYALPIN